MIVCLPFSLSALQLLVVSFIVYWECGYECECDPELVVEYPGSLVIFIDTTVKKIRNKVPIRQNLPDNPPLLSKVSRKPRDIETCDKT